MLGTIQVLVLTVAVNRWKNFADWANYDNLTPQHFSRIIYISRSIVSDNFHYYIHEVSLLTPVSQSKHVDDTYLFYYTGPSPTVAPNETTTISIFPPTSVMLPNGANFTFTSVTNSPVQSFRWQFNFGELPGNALPRNTSSTSSQLVIRNVTQSNAGTYICTATFANGDVRSSFVQIIYLGMKT